MIILEITKQMEMILYHSEQRNITVNAIIKDETIWITQKAMAELFGVKIPAISKHLKNIFEDGELNEELVVSKMEIATPHGAIPEFVRSHWLGQYLYPGKCYCKIGVLKRPFCPDFPYNSD